MQTTESDLLDWARQRLEGLLPARIRLSAQAVERDGEFDTASDALWQLEEQRSGCGLILVLANRVFPPREVGRMLDGMPAMVRQAMGNPTILVIAPWLSPRTRELLEERGLSYLDMTGNILFRVDRPAVFIRLQGTDRNASPPQRTPARLRGAKARRLVRLLVDVTPPYRLTELARTGHLNPGYVSRLLEALNDQAFIERDRRGSVDHVDWPALLKAASNDYQLLRTNSASLYISQAGATDLYTRLADAAAPGVVVTGSFAATAIAPIAAPAQLTLYSTDPAAVRDFGRLLPAERGADVVLLRPKDPMQIERTRWVDGVTHVSLSQLVLDLIGGGGRLPEEAPPVINWMRDHEDEWRLPTLPTQNG